MSPASRPGRKETGMDTIWIVLAVIAVIVVLGAAWWGLQRRRRTERLAERYGPEYQRTLAEAGDRRAAEHELEEREKRVQELDIKPLAPEERDRFAAEWRRVQAQFVDDPSGAIAEGDRLVEQVMEARGYPTADSDFGDRAAIVSVDHGAVVEEYRAAHDIAERHASTEGGVETEDLRQAMVHYRAIFEDLLETAEPEPVEARR